MKLTYFTPGPSQLYPTVPQHLQRALDEQIGSISHRSGRFMDIMRETQSHLRELLGIPEEYRIYFFGSATEVWERLVQNCIEKSSFHLVNGNFSERFYQTALDYGKAAQVLQLADGAGFGGDLEVPDTAELIGCIANETSTGVWTPPEWIHALAAKYPEKLTVVDVVSAYPNYNLKLENVDGSYFSVQKGFGCPAGLGVGIFSPRILEKAQALTEKGLPTGSYHSFSSLESKATKFQTPETPNVLGIYLLGKVAGDMLATGESLRQEHLAKAKALYDFFDSAPGFSPAVAPGPFRSESVIVVNTEEASSRWVERLRGAGYVPGQGYGADKERQLRIANFPATSPEDVQGLIDALRAYL